MQDILEFFSTFFNLPTRATTLEELVAHIPSVGNEATPELLLTPQRIRELALQAAALEPRSTAGHGGRRTSPGAFDCAELAPEVSLSDDASAIWALHVYVNEDQALASDPTLGDSDVRLRASIPEDLERFLGTTPVRILPAIGTHFGSSIAGAILAGPRRNHLLIAKGVVKQPLDVMFLLYHMYHHIILRHVSRNELGYRFEYERGKTPQQMLDLPGYIEQEAIVDDGATCLWDDWYIDSYQMSPFSWMFARGALAGSGLEKPVIRWVFRNRPGLRRIIATRFLRPLYKALGPAYRFSGPMAVVQGNDRHMFLLCYGGARQWKRWIPSHKVLARLEVSASAVAFVGDKELERYEDGRILIDPKEVREARDVLKSTGVPLPMPNLFTPARLRLGMLRSDIPISQLPHVCSEAACRPDLVERLPLEVTISTNT
jgi:hypothetical protein